MMAAVCSQLSRLSLQLFAPVARQPVEARLAVVLGGAPFGGDGTLLLQLQQNGIQRALIDREQISADLLDAPRDPVAVQRPQHIQSLEHHQRQRALPDIRFLYRSLGFQQEA